VLTAGNEPIAAIESVSVIGGNGSVGLSDERPLSVIGIHWQLSGDESEERTVAERPQADRCNLICGDSKRQISCHFSA